MRRFPLSLAGDTLLCPLLSRIITTSGLIVLIGLLPWLSGRDPALSILRAKSGEQEASVDALNTIRTQLGLEQGPVALLLSWGRNLLHGNAGDSWISGKPVLPGMLEATGVSLTLMGVAMAITLVVGMLLCVFPLIQGLQGRPSQSHGASAIALITLPEYLLAALLLLIGAVWLGWFPPYGWSGWQYVILPALALGLPAGGMFGRLLADAISSAFLEPWLITWRVAGVSHFHCAAAVLYRALPTILPQLGLMMVGLTGGAVAVEKIFAIPGLGRATLGAAAAQDLPALQCGVLLLLAIAAVSSSMTTLLRILILGSAVQNGSLPTPREQPRAVSRRHGVALCLALILSVVVIGGLLRDPLASDFMRLQPPSFSLPFGADATGRDMLARLGHGAFSTLLTAVLVTLVSLVVGLLVGCFPRLLTGPIDVANAMPPMMAGLIVVAITGPSILGAACAVALVSWAPFAAHTAALVDEIKARPYVRITPLLGVGPGYRLINYILPALLGPLSRHALVRFPGVALALTALGFLGLGQPPPYPEWGRILAEGLPYMERAPWTVLAPVLALMLLAILASSLSQETPSKRIQ